MSSRRPGLSTLAIHGVPRRRPDWSPVAPSVVQSSTFTNPVGSTDDVLYTRYGNTPTQVELARKYALLEGAESAIFLASGMGATARRIFDETYTRSRVTATYAALLSGRTLSPTPQYSARSHEA